MAAKKLIFFAIPLVILVVGGGIFVLSGKENKNFARFPFLPDTHVEESFEPHPPPLINKPPPPATLPPPVKTVHESDLREKLSFSKELIDILDTFEVMGDVIDITAPAFPPPSPGTPLPPEDELEFSLPVLYREKLAAVENALVQAGYIKESEKEVDFTKIENIQRQQKRFIEFLASHETDEFYKVPGNKEAALRSVDQDLPRIIQARADHFRSLSGYEKKKALARVRPGEDGLFEKIIAFFTPETASAIVWESYTACYFTFVGPGAKIPNFAIPWYSCNSGLHVYYCGFSVCVDYYDNCGYLGKIPCNVPLGCLNLICISSQSGLFNDPGGVPAKTAYPGFICGCG